jgi:hypothetical protein
MRIFVSRPSMSTILINAPESIICESLNKGESAFTNISHNQTLPCSGSGAGAVVLFFIGNEGFEQHIQYKNNLMAFLFMLRKTGYELNYTAKSLSVELDKVCHCFSADVERIECLLRHYAIKKHNGRWFR